MSHSDSSTAACSSSWNLLPCVHTIGLPDTAECTAANAHCLLVSFAFMMSVGDSVGILPKQLVNIFCNHDMQQIAVGAAHWASHPAQHVQRIMHNMISDQQEQLLLQEALTNDMTAGFNK